MKKALSVLSVLMICALLLTSCLSSTPEPSAAADPASSEAAQESSEAAPDNSEAPAKPAQVYKIGSAATPGEAMAEAGQMFCDLATERLGGEIVFEYYPAEQLGNETTMFENLQVDLQQGLANAFDSYGNYAADLNIMSMAFAFENHEHLFKYLESEHGQAAFDKLEDQGIHVLNYNFRKNPRCIFGKSAITSPDDLVGVKFRVANIPIWEKNFRTLGAVPTVVAWSEYPYALIQGVVDAGECTYENIYPMKFHQSCPYITLVDYAYPLECISLSKEAWDRLTPEQQEIVQQCADEASEMFNSKITTRWEEDKENIIEEGGQFVEFDKEPFMEKMAPLADELEGESFWDTPGLYEIVQSMR